MMNISLNGNYGNNYGSPFESARYGASYIGGSPSGRDIALPGNIKKQEKERKERLGIEDPTEECQTCKNRKYKDGSNEMVSFKSPAHISPESSAATVRAHEQEHVNNAYAKAATADGGAKVVSASVSLQMSVCPECGRSYVSGGTTSTQIKYYNEDNPYQKDLKATDHEKYAGMNLDCAV